MPIYEYQCNRCETHFERLVRRITEADNDVPTCPQCGSDETQRVISVFARHGEPGVDHEAVQAERAAAERAASVTPKSLIDKWRSQEKK